MYKPGKLENLLDRPTEKMTVQQTEGSIWQTIKNKLAEIQQAAIDNAPKK